MRSKGKLQTRKVHYWRDKRGHEVDFVFAPRGKAPVAIECKWSAREFDPVNLSAFRHHYPKGANYVVCEDVEKSYTRQKASIEWQYVSLSSLLSVLAQAV